MEPVRNIHAFREISNVDQRPFIGGVTVRLVVVVGAAIGQVADVVEGDVGAGAELSVTPPQYRTPTGESLASVGNGNQFN